MVEMIIVVLFFLFHTRIYYYYFFFFFEIYIISTIIIYTTFSSRCYDPTSSIRVVVAFENNNINDWEVFFIFLFFCFKLSP